MKIKSLVSLHCPIIPDPLPDLMTLDLSWTQRARERERRLFWVEQLDRWWDLLNSPRFTLRNVHFNCNRISFIAIRVSESTNSVLLFCALQRCDLYLGGEVHMHCTAVELSRPCTVSEVGQPLPLNCGVAWPLTNGIYIISFAHSVALWFNSVSSVVLSCSLKSWIGGQFAQSIKYKF